MANFKIFRGGPCHPGCLPHCQGTQLPTKLPYSKRIAAEYHRGFFTLGSAFNPLQQPYQKNFLAGSTIAVGDKFSTIEVPQEHTLLDLFYEVEVMQDVHPAITRIANNMAGFAFDVFADRYDSTGALLGSVTLPSALAGISGSTKAAKRAPVSASTLGYYVERGEYLEVGFKVAALPSTPGVTLADISGYVHIVGHVMAYDSPNML